MLVAYGISSFVVAGFLIAFRKRFGNLGQSARYIASSILVPLGVALLATQFGLQTKEEAEKTIAINILRAEKLELEGALAAYEKMHADILSAKVDSNSLSMFPLSNTRSTLTNSPAVMAHLSEEGLQAMSQTEGRLQGLVHDMIKLRGQEPALLSKLDEITVMHREIIRRLQANIEELRN